MPPTEPFSNIRTAVAKCRTCTYPGMVESEWKASGHQFIEAINNLPIYCENAHRGCNHVVSRKTLKAHLLGECRFVNSYCGLCSQEVKRGEESDHNTNKCPERKMICKYCGEKTTACIVNLHETDATRCPLIGDFLRAVDHPVVKNWFQNMKKEIVHHLYSRKRSLPLKPFYPGSAEEKKADALGKELNIIYTGHYYNFPFRLLASINEPSLIYIPWKDLTDPVEYPVEQNKKEELQRLIDAGEAKPNENFDMVVTKQGVEKWLEEEWRGSEWGNHPVKKWLLNNLLPRMNYECSDNENTAVDALMIQVQEGKSTPKKKQRTAPPPLCLPVMNNKEYDQELASLVVNVLKQIYENTKTRLEPVGKSRDELYQYIYAHLPPEEKRKRSVKDQVYRRSISKNLSRTKYTTADGTCQLRLFL